MNESLVLNKLGVKDAWLKFFFKLHSLCHCHMSFRAVDVLHKLYLWQIQVQWRQMILKSPLSSVTSVFLQAQASLPRILCM